MSELPIRDHYWMPRGDGTPVCEQCGQGPDGHLRPAFPPGQIPTDEKGRALGPDGKPVIALPDADSWVEYDEKTGLAVMRNRDGRVVYLIDVPADLNFEDDDGLVLARVPEGKALRVGDVVTAGGSTSWTWAVVAGVEQGWVRLRPVGGPDAVTS